MQNLPLSPLPPSFSLADLSIWFWIPLGLAAMLFGRRWLRHRREKIIHPDRLWRMPALMTAIILPLILLQPHRPFTRFDIAVFLIAMLLGMTTGAIRARATTLRYDPETAQIMAGFSLSALVFLFPVGIARYVSRDYLGIGPEAVHHGEARAIIGSLLFVLAMFISHRALLYRRSRAVRIRHEKD
jgi:hypothetical protein